MPSIIGYFHFYGWDKVSHAASGRNPCIDPRKYPRGHPQGKKLRLLVYTVIALIFLPAEGKCPQILIESTVKT